MQHAQHNHPFWLNAPSTPSKLGLSNKMKLLAFSATKLLTSADPRAIPHQFSDCLATFRKFTVNRATTILDLSDLIALELVCELRARHGGLLASKVTK